MAKRIVVFFSGNGSNLQALIDTCDAGFLNCNIVFALTNKSDAYGLARAEKAKISTQVLDHTLYTREEYDRLLISTVDNYTPDLIVLAGWNRILTSVFIGHYGKRIINLHPSLPNGLIGLNAIRKAWIDYHQNGVRDVKSGVMIHHLIEEVDKGEVISYMTVPMIDDEPFDKYQERMHNAEHSILVNTVKSLTTTVSKTNNEVYESKVNNPLVSVMSGKVRNVYDLGYGMYVMEHSNRLSSFDRHICDIKGKGEILTATSAWWFRLIQRDLNIPSHYIWSNKHVMVVKKCKLLPVEVVVRGYITGSTKTSLWTHYKQGVRTYCGITFPDGLVKNQKLDHPVITPTTKGIEDVPISGADVVRLELMSQSQWDEVSRKAMQLFKYGQTVAEQQGLLLVDTKYEFGLDEAGNVLLIDEVHTCDSSRFWFKDSYAVRFEGGIEPDKYDKDVIRDYIKKSVNDPYSQTSFDVPIEMKERTTSIYTDFYRRLTAFAPELAVALSDCVCDVDVDVDVCSNTRSNTEFYSRSLVEAAHNLEMETLNTVESFLETDGKPVLAKMGCVVILAGSTSDEKHVEKIKTALKKQKIPSYVHYASAHKNTQLVLSLLNEYNGMNGRVVYVTVAGRSNALSGVVACNTKYPTIACPPFSDKDDFMVNINSTLQMPSNVPVMTILEPGNVAISVKRMFMTMV